MFTQRERDIFEHAEIGEQRAALKQHSHPLPQLVQVPPLELVNADAIHLDTSSVRPQLAADELQQGGLAGAARPHDRGDFPPRDIQIDLVKNRPPVAMK